MPCKKPKRLTPWQEKELSGLEDGMPTLEAKLAELDERLADPTLYTGPRAELDDLRREREVADAALSEAYARWEELESLRGS